MVQSQQAASLTIGKLASTANVGVETVRFYQRRGLLELPTRDGGFRRYCYEDVRRLRFIKQAQAAGFTLEDIRKLLELDAIGDRTQARVMATERIIALDVKIEELKQARKALQALASECGSGSSGPCPILSAFDVRNANNG